MTRYYDPISLSVIEIPEPPPPRPATTAADVLELLRAAWVTSGHSSHQGQQDG